MDFLQELGSHRGGLLLLKAELFWFGGRGWDGTRGRICILMDARDADGIRGTATPVAVATAAATAPSTSSSTAVLLLVDGCPHWIWVAEADVELL